MKKAVRIELYVQKFLRKEVGDGSLSVASGVSTPLNDRAETWLNDRAESPLNDRREPLNGLFL